MAAMALLGLAYALHTQALRRGYDVQLPKSRAIDVPLFARVALGIYVAGLVGAIVWGWNRRERAAGDEARPWTSRLGVPGLAVLALVGIGLALLAIRARPVRPPLDLDHPKTEAVAPSTSAKRATTPRGATCCSASASGGRGRRTWRSGPGCGWTTSTTRPWA
jgi:hypothetical protein